MANNWKDVVSVSRKYGDRCRFPNWGDYDKFMDLVNSTHLTVGVEDSYSNRFFPQCYNGRSQWFSASEINDNYKLDTDYRGKYRYTAPTLLSYVRLGLMEVDKTVKPFRYTFPTDFFETNDLSIKFEKSVSIDF